MAIENMFDVVVEEALDFPPPPVLYHYTNWPAAEGILSTQVFWATAHHCTNDPAELVSADDIIVEVARELKRRSSGVASAVLKLFVKNYKNSRISRLRTIYLASFSIARDDKEQWQKYADYGRGICLGIRLLNEPGPRHPDLPSRLLPVDYSEESWRAGLLENLGQIVLLLERAQPVRRNIELGLSALYRIAAYAAISAKQHAWAVEKEFRLATFLRDAAKAKHYEQLANGRRYIPMPVRAAGRRIAFAEILIGSNQNPQSAQSKLEGLLESSGYVAGDFEYPTIMRSSI